MEISGSEKFLKGGKEENTMRPIDMLEMRLENALYSKKPRYIVRLGLEALAEIELDLRYEKDRKARKVMEELRERIGKRVTEARKKLSWLDRLALKFNPPRDPREYPL